MSEQRRLDICVSSYRNPEKLTATLESIQRNTVSDWRCFVFHNPAWDQECTAAMEIIAEASIRNLRFEPMLSTQNIGYAGAVNCGFKRSDTDYFAYLDNDIEIQTPGWDEKLCAILDAHPEVGQVFPGEGHYGFHNGQYHECLWNAGYAWIARRSAIEGTKQHLDIIHPAVVMDTSLGHHEEVDLMIRLRMAGYQIAACPDVSVLHHASATNSPESQKRIHAGVVRWMNKWNRYFCGDVLKYPNPDPDSGEGYDPRSLRYTDWPPCALYLERWTLAQFPDWNEKPRTIQTSAGPMDAVEILKPKGCYIGRAI